MQEAMEETSSGSGRGPFRRRRMPWLGGLAPAVAFCAVAIFSAGCLPRSAPTDEWAGMVAPPVLKKASLHYYWRYKISLQDGEKVERIWRLDENLYALTSANRLVAIDAANGRYKWSYPMSQGEQKIFAPCHADGVAMPAGEGISELLEPGKKGYLEPFDAVIVNTLSYALLIDRDTGKLVRKLDFDFAANTPGSSDGVYFYVASIKGRYYAVRLSEGLNQWTMATGDTITTAPQVYDSRLYVASHDGKFYAVNPNAGANRRLWTRLTDGPISAGFVVDERGCFVPSQDYRLHAYDRLTGADLWTFIAQGQLRSPVQVGRQTVFQLADKDRFYAINLANGRKRWEIPDGRIVLAPLRIDTDPYVLVLTAGRQLMLVHEILGNVETSFPMSGLDMFIPNASRPVIYAATRDGKVVCIRPISASAGRLTPKMLKD